jgi:hypothetical protein
MFAKLFHTTILNPGTPIIIRNTATNQTHRRITHIPMTTTPTMRPVSTGRDIITILRGTWTRIFFGHSPMS